MARQYEDQVAIVGVASRDDVSRFEEFVERHGLEHVPHIADVDGLVWQEFGVAYQPVWVFVDGGSGDVEAVFGAVGEEELSERFGDGS